MKPESSESIGYIPTNIHPDIRRILNEPEFGNIREKKVLDTTYTNTQSGLFTLKIPPVIRPFAFTFLCIAVLTGFFVLYRWYKNRTNAENISEEETPADTAVHDIVKETDLTPKNAILLLESGNSISALSVLYRGCLKYYEQKHLIRFSPGSTEKTCLKRVKDKLRGVSVQYFTDVTNAWSQAAYGRLIPAEETIRQLADNWQLLEKTA